MNLVNLCILYVEVRDEWSNTNNSFNGSFTSNCQDKSIPHKLVTLVNLIIDGCGVENTEYSQQALTIAQLIQTNFHKWEKTDATTHRHLVKPRETPASLYVALKIYSTVWSKVWLTITLILLYAYLMTVLLKFQGNYLMPYFACTMNMKYSPQLHWRKISSLLMQKII